MNLSQTILSVYFDAIDIRFTHSYAKKLYNEHPHKYNMYGLSNMLEHYGLETAGIKVDNKKDDIFSLPIPFIAFVGNDFVTVKRVSDNTVTYVGHGNNINAPFDDFIKIWSGIALISEKTETAGEPNYIDNRKKELFTTIQEYLLFGLLILVCVFFFFGNQIYNNIWLALSSIINCFGIYVSYLLVKKQMHIQSIYADKICSLFGRAGCNNILESKASKLWGIFGWSEIGFAYFFANLILILVVPQLISYLALINICALPYSFWSVWYQRFRAKQWCPLCLIIQGLFWMLFFFTLLGGFVSFPAISLSNIIITSSIYLIPFLAISIILPPLSASNQVENIRQEMNSIKASDEIFLALLKQQPYFKIDCGVSKILFGNPQAKNLITIVSNPHCNPCAKLHERIDSILEKYANKICFQYIFTSFKGMEDSTFLLISNYLRNETKDYALKIFSEWYKNGKNEKDKFKKKYTSEENTDDVNEEYTSHKIWCEKNNIQGTPTIFFNGYRLPENYKIEDIVYFIDLDVDTK